MKVLHLPYNIATNLTIALKSLKQVDDVEVRGLVLMDQHILHNYDGVKVIPRLNNQRYSFKWFINVIRRYYFFFVWVAWADVIHWYWDDKILTRGLALKWIKFLRKPALVEFTGSEIRRPSVEFEDNPWYIKHYEEIANDTAENIENASKELQSKFADAGFETTACPEMRLFLDPDSFPDSYRLMQRIIAEDYEPSFPDPDELKPIIVHAPSKPLSKGTAYVERAIEKVKATCDVEFEFRLVTGVSYEEANRQIKNCDLFIDQMGNGGGCYGMATMEAMANGKPVMTYIRPRVLQDLPSSLPIILVDADNLADKIIAFLKDGKLRQETGMKSRTYIEEFHDTKKLNPKLLNIYKRVIDNRNHG